jgi:hypothetical protein
VMFRSQPTWARNAVNISNGSHSSAAWSSIIASIDRNRHSVLAPPLDLHSFAFYMMLDPSLPSI